VSKDDLCQNCQQRPATHNWVGNGSTMEFIHGMYARWCEYCVTVAQLEHARAAAAKISELEKRLAAVEQTR
jgi:protein-arginine kinase activator protein McsA